MLYSLSRMCEDLILRTEQKKDYVAVDHLLKAAFDQRDEADLVHRLRESKAFIPELSIVATCEERIVGYILFTRISIINGNESYPSLALAPVAVLPEMQSKGIGSALIEFGHAHCRQLGHGSLIVLGHEDYYPKFGFQPAENWNITCPFPVPSKNFMALELRPGSLDGVSGEVRYAHEFGL